MTVDPQIFFDPKKGVTDKYYCLQGGYIRDFAFDPSGYKLPAEYIAGMDDLFQWSLYVARQALQDAGYADDEVVLQRTGIILGNLSFPTQASHRLFEPIYRDGVIAGYLTSGMYGHTLGAAVGLGYVENSEGVSVEYISEGSYEIEVAGVRVPATASLRPLYDPNSERVKM